MSSSARAWPPGSLVIPFLREKLKLRRRGNGPIPAGPGTPRGPKLEQLEALAGGPVLSFRDWGAAGSCSHPDFCMVKRRWLRLPPGPPASRPGHKLGRHGNHSFRGPVTRVAFARSPHGRRGVLPASVPRSRLQRTFPTCNDTPGSRGQGRGQLAVTPVCRRCQTWTCRGLRLRTPPVTIRAAGFHGYRGRAASQVRSLHKGVASQRPFAAPSGSVSSQAAIFKSN